MPKIKILIAVLVLAGIAAGGAYWYVGGPRTVSAALTLYGNVDIRQVALAFNVAERITEMDAEEGEQVKKGQLLAVLDTRRFNNRVAQAEAQVAAQQQVVAALVAGSRPEEIHQAQANAKAAEVEAHNAQVIAKRQADLQRRGLTSKENTDDARAAADAAAARLRAAQAALELITKGPRQEDIAAAKASLQALQAQLALDRNDLDDARLTAPVDGVIEDRILQPGDMASPQTPVYTLSLTQPLWVRAYAEETELGKIFPGMQATVTTDSFPGKQYQGWVGFISPTAEFTPKNVETPDVRTNLVYQVRVFVCNPNNELRQGMPATVTLPLHQTPGSKPGCGPAGNETSSATPDAAAP